MTDDRELFAALPARVAALRASLGEVIVGQEEVIELLFTALFADGHAIFVGVPGLAKTLLVRTLASTLGVRFRRVQFTPDLMPADLTGTEVLDEDRATGRRSLRFVEGPVFTDLLLADEINRTPPKTQAALLEAMQERTVSTAGETRELGRPFLVFATRNPIEQEGTYPLPEAQQDRFLLSIPVEYPSEIEEIAMVTRTTSGEPRHARQVMEREELLAYQQLIRRLPAASQEVVGYAVRLARGTRGGTRASAHLRWGAGPRASQALFTAARARAALEGKIAPGISDIRAVAPAVLRHRIVLHFEAEAQGVTADAVIASLLAEVK